MLLPILLAFHVLTSANRVTSISTDENNDTCTTWMYRINASSPCVCGDSLNDAVRCDPLTQQVKVRRCYMITIDPNSHEPVAAQSLYTCVRYFYNNYQTYIPVSFNESQINFENCNFLNRDGLFCGACKREYSPLVYSYKLNCKKCSETEMIQNWFIFIAVSLIPVTLFYLFVLLAKFNANCASLQGFVLIAQLTTQPYFMKILITQFSASHSLAKVLVYTLAILYDVWNLNFFRVVSPDICLHVSTLGALSLEYVVAFYPILLIVFTYSVVELHSRGYRLIITMWRPFQRCLLHFRKNWNIKSSLIDVFATFWFLSYNRLLDISFSLLMPITAYNSRGDVVGRYLYYDSSKKFFGEEHLPFGILAIVVLLIFNCIPLLILLLYPLKWFQRFLNCTKFNYIALHTFVDRFTGCYKDGTEPGTRDCRYFAASFLLLRFANFIIIVCTYDAYYFLILIITILFFTVLFIFAQPYKSKFSQHNFTVTVFLMIGICLYCCVLGVQFAKLIHPPSFSSIVAFVIIIAFLPNVYIAYLVLKFVCGGVP